MEQRKIIALLGDSITEFLPFIFKQKVYFNQEMAADDFNYNYRICGIENIGIGTYHEFIWKQVKKDDVECFALLLGINNILRPDCDEDNKESLIDAYNKLILLINDIKNTNPKLIVQSLYPTSKFETNCKVNQLNEMIKEYCKSNTIYYLDLFSMLVNEEGVINPSYTDDGLHPNEVGYRVILKELERNIVFLENKENSLKEQKTNKDRTLKKI